MPVWKRSVDLSFCVLVLPLLGASTLVMYVITRLVSPGPVFFRQERVGFMGHRFRIYKFRTMRMGADTIGHQDHFKNLVGSNAPMVKLDAHNDARLIPGAWFLRASGLDELPQLINVLRGEMSLVGPRPCLPTEFQLFRPSQKKRCLAVPGLTGLWQVSGKNRTTFEEMIDLDIRYARTRTLLMDLKISLMTVPALVVQIYDTRSARKSAAGDSVAKRERDRRQGGDLTGIRGWESHRAG